MKVKFDTDQRNTQEPVAFIDQDGDLVLMNPYVDVGWCLCDDCVVVELDSHDMLESKRLAQRMIYPGDKITISF